MLLAVNLHSIRLQNLRLKYVISFQNENCETKLLSVPYYCYARTFGKMVKDQGITFHSLKLVRTLFMKVVSTFYILMNIDITLTEYFLNKNRKPQHYPKVS